MGHYAAALGPEPVRVAAILARLLGKTTKRAIDERPALEAKRALRYTDRPLNEIAAALGYADQVHRSKTFKRLAGVTPQAFRQHAGK